MLWQKILGASKAAAAGQQLSVVSEASSYLGGNTSTIRIPFAVSVGDVMVLTRRQINSTGTPAAKALSGWTYISNIASGTRRQELFYKIAQSGDAGSTINLTPRATSNETVMILTVRPDFAASTVALNLYGEQITDSAPSNQSSTLTSRQSPLIYAVYYGSSGVVTSDLFSSRTGAVEGSTTANYLAYQIFNGTPSQNITAAMADRGSGNTLISFSLEVS